MLRGCSQWGIPAERIYLHKLSFVSYACGYIVYIVLQVCNPRYSGEYKLNYISLFNFPIFHHYFDLFYCYDHSYTHFRHQLHPKSCHTCILGGDVEPFGPSPSTHLIWRRGGPKYGYFWVKIGVAMAGWLPVEEPTWKLSYEPYHI